MKRRLVRWLAIATRALGMALQAGLVGAAAPERTVYLALGDSLAAGVGAVSLKAQGAYEGRVGYVLRFFHALRASTGGEPQVLTNLAVRGETSESFVDKGQLASAVAAINDPDTDVQVVTLDIGGNDLLAVLGGACANPANPDCLGAVEEALSRFAEKYSTILGTLRAALADDPGAETILVMTYYNPFGGTGLAAEALADSALLGTDGAINCATGGARFSWGLTDLIACLGMGFSVLGVTVQVVDVYPLFGDNALALTHIVEGDIHPNNAGHKLIAEAFAAAYTAP